MGVCKKPWRDFCIKGKYYIFEKNKKISFKENKNFNCIEIDKNIATRILAYNISSADQLQVKYKSPQFYLFTKIFKLILLTFISIIFIRTFFKLNYEPVLITIVFSFISFYLIEVSREFRGFYEHKYLLLGGGSDALTYWGFARDMMHSILKGDVLNALSGSEKVFFYMPGYRYFLFFQSFIFGESQIAGWFFIIIIPSIIFFLMKKLTTNFNAFIITFLFSFFFIINYYKGVFMHGEALSYPMALLSIIFTIKTIEEKSLILKNKYIFIHQSL